MGNKRWADGDYLPWPVRESFQGAGYVHGVREAAHG